MANNPTIEVEIQDTTATKGRRAEVPSNVAVGKLVAALVRQLGLPQVGPDGQMVSYKLHHKESGSQLDEDSTLDQVGVESGAVLRLQAELTAGIGYPI